MKTLRACAIAGLLLAAGGLFGPAVAGSKSVVELFTSQGCSSCPPADAHLGELAKRPDVVALSLPVDYWDFLGWKDTMASPAHSERQRAYARMRGDSQIYTPQMVINGSVHAIGSRRDDVAQEIERTSEALADLSVDVGITQDADRFIVDVAGTRMPTGLAEDEATVWLVLFSKEETVDIGRGENSGRTITYHNVVREMMPIGVWSGAPVSISLPRDDLMRMGHDGCAVLVQVKGTGPILGAAMIETQTIASN